MLIEFDGRRPQVAESAFIAPTAVLIGDVVVGEEASVWYGAVLRADFGRIVIGARANVQDNATIHPDKEAVLEEEATVGHGAILEGCRVERGAIIGIGAIVLEGATIGEQAVVAAGSVVLEGAEVPPRTLVAGIPAVLKKQISGESLKRIELTAKLYVEISRSYRLQK